MIYTIDKFNHRHNSCIPLVDRITWKDRIDFIFKFKSDPTYEVPNKEDQKDTNKIFGISDSWHHHQHSIRIGWRHNPDTNETTYCTYYYRDGKHYTEDLGPVKINQDIYVCIEIKNDCYRVTTIDKQIDIPRTSRWFGPRYFLFPYFGGQQVAPKQFKIKINKW
jgi:hypothetical protein